MPTDAASLLFDACDDAGAAFKSRFRAICTNHQAVGGFRYRASITP
jgi:hypothetical protein